MEFILPETNLLQIKKIEGEESNATFIFEPLSPGYGMTIGNSLRRILLSSLSGAAISFVKIDGVTHEFSTIPGVKEDMIELLLNLKGLRFRLHGDEATTIILEANKAGEILAKDFKANPQIEIIDPKYHIATLDKGGKLFLEAYIEKGRGYIPTEMKKEQKMPLGTISVDSFFTPVKKVRYEIENTRVGRMTNFDKLTMEITTDGTVTPEDAMMQAAQILVDHFGLIATLNQERSEPVSIENQIIEENTDEVEKEMEEFEDEAMKDSPKSKTRKRSKEIDKEEKKSSKKSRKG